MEFCKGESPFKNRISKQGLTSGGRAYVVERSFHAHADGLLTIIQVAESTNELALVHNIGRDLHTAHHVHVREHLVQLTCREPHVSA